MDVHDLARARARYMHKLHVACGGNLTWWDIANCYKWALDCAAWLPVAIAAIDEARGWRPIESAPRGKAILAVVDGKTRIVAWGKTSHVPLYGWNLADQGAEDYELCNPTHWQPLPAPPKEG